MVRCLFIPVAVAALCGCSLAPDRAEPSWTDALLAQSPPGAAPASAEGQPMDNDVLRDMLRSAVMVQYQGQSVRQTGVVLRAPTLDTADFVVEARARARPPARQ